MERSKRQRLPDKPLSTRHEVSHPLPISSRALQISEALLRVRPLTLVLGTVIAPAIERLALIEDAFCSLSIVRLLETYGISSALTSILTVLLASLQLRKALQKQRDLTLLALGTAWPIWRTISVPDATARPRRIEAYWTIFALLNAFDATRVHPHPLEPADEAPPITSTLYYRFRPVVRLVEKLNVLVQKRVFGKDAPLVPAVFPEPLPYYRSAMPATSTLPRLSLAMRTFGTSWPYLRLLLLWALSINDFALANRLLAPFRSPRPRPPGKRVVTVVTLQDAPEELPRDISPTPPISPPKTPEVEQSDFVAIATDSSHHSELDAHRIWSKSDGSVTSSL